MVGIDARGSTESAAPFAPPFDLTFPLVYDGPGDAIGPMGPDRVSRALVINRQGTRGAERSSARSTWTRSKRELRLDDRPERSSREVRAALAALPPCPRVSVRPAPPGPQDPPRAADLEAELVCPVCETTLDQSNARFAER